MKAVIMAGESACILTTDLPKPMVPSQPYDGCH